MFGIKIKTLFDEAREKEDIKTKLALSGQFEDSEETTSQPEPEPEEKLKEEKYVWVDGFKGTAANMTCYGNYQFELNKEFTAEGDIEMCHNGFHFCDKLNSVFGFYPIEYGNRYFKVKAYVSETELNKTPEYVFHHDIPYKIDKRVARKIILTEEIGFEELLPYIQRKCRFISTKEDFELAQKIGFDKYRRQYFMKNMVDSGFGETFLNIIFDEIVDESHTYSSESRIEDTMKFIKALNEEGVSKDMAVYLLLQRIK